MSEYQQITTSTHDLPGTKFALPRLRQQLLPREQLLSLLDQSLDYPFTLISAPAGFGKTTLVRAWIASRSPHKELFSFVWLSLDTGDNDPARFWRYAMAASQYFVGSTVLAPAEDLRSAQAFSRHVPAFMPFETILTSFINTLNELTGPVVLVLEDYHVITSPQIHETMTFLLDHLPATFHLILLTRSDPPFPLARLRAHDDLLEIRTPHLSFSPEETHAFLQLRLPFSLPEEITRRLHERTEGWSAGLSLVVSTLHRYTHPQERARFLETLTGRYRPLLEYLISEVLQNQPESIQTFLLQTSSLSRLTASLCDAVTGRDDSDLILEQIEQENLFLEPLDGAGQWYRYHPLFAEAMQHVARRRLGKEALTACFNRASVWYEQHQQMANAIEVSLLAQNIPRTVQLLERLSESFYIVQTSEFYTVRRWFGQIPLTVLKHQPILCQGYATMLMFELDGRTITRNDGARREQVETLLTMAEEHWLAEKNSSHVGEVYALRSLLASWQEDYRTAGAYARKSLANLSREDTIWRGLGLSMIGAEERASGSLDAAYQNIQQGLALILPTGHVYSIRAILLELGELYIAQGLLHQAARNFQQVMIEAGEDLMDSTKALVGLSRLSYEHNHLDTAYQQAQEAQAQAMQLGDRELQMRASLQMARIHYAHGRHVDAEQQFADLETQAQLYATSPLFREILYWQARLQLASGTMPTVQHHRKRRLVDEHLLPFSLRLQEDLLAARFQIASGDKQLALSALAQCLIRVQQHSSTALMLEIQLLQAAVCYQLDDHEAARRMLQTMFPLARSEGYQRLFLDEGQEVVTCIQALISSLDAKEDQQYLRTLLPTLNSRQTLSSTPAWMEPLSQQEQRVLRFFVAGLSKAEIASELIVSVNTVKTHLQRIYRKLNVTSRAEAREVVQRYHLL